MFRSFAMSAAVERKRITVRVSRAVAETLNEAAVLAGTTVTSFVIQAALEKAERVVEREKMVRLSRNDAAMLLDLLEKPLLPNATLTRAFERFRNARCNRKR
jgi:uncharacterized protein (DUF1778 family)